jgi:hypothetical protein
MKKTNKPKDFTLTGFIGKGENLVTNKKQESFYLVDEIKYDLANVEDEIQCEVLYSNENDKNITYLRHVPAIKIKLKRGELQSVPLKS